MKPSVAAVVAAPRRARAGALRRAAGLARSSSAPCRSPASARSQSSPGRFDLVGCAGTGPARSGSAPARRTAAGGRGSTRPPEEEDASRTQARPRLASSRGWRVGSPTWVGPSNGIRYRITRQGARSPGHVRPQPGARRSRCGRSLRRGASDRAAERVGCRRDDRDGDAAYAPAIRFAVVHHTAGTNDVHARAGGRDSAGDRGLPRQVERLERHRLQLPRRPVRHRLRGRAGGIDRNVVGAHVLGFNTGSVGVAVMGTFARAAYRRRWRRRSRSSSPGGSTSPTSTRSRA